MSSFLEQKETKRLIGEFGSPLYVFHEEEFRDNYLHLLNSIRAIYPKYNVCYSYKTNYTPYICQIVKDLGGFAEVVSEMEYELAKRIGYNSNQIIYNGPIKGKGLFEHLSNGGTINVDSLDELESIVDFAYKHKEKTFKIAFRVNLDIGQGFISRFGLDTSDFNDRPNEISKAFSIVRKVNNLMVTGVHCHIGKSRSLSSWKKRVEEVFGLLDKYFVEELEFIDFGSGMNSVMEPELAKQFNETIPTFEEYADVLAVAMKKRYGGLPNCNQPWLFTEPGTTLVSGSVSFLSTVKSIKNIRGQQFVTFDCSGGNMGDICRLKQLPISVFHNPSKKSVECKGAIFAGYTCLESDYIYKEYNGEIAVGDFVQFRNVGSYSNVFKPPFILPNCAMVAYSNKKNNKIKLIKAKESFEDIFKTYIF